MRSFSVTVNADACLEGLRVLTILTDSVYMRFIIIRARRVFYSMYISQSDWLFIMTVMLPR